jgi:hypothetical protein
MALENIQGTFRELSGDIQGTFREHSLNIAVGEEKAYRSVIVQHLKNDRYSGPWMQRSKYHGLYCFGDNMLQLPLSSPCKFRI